jgi:N-acetyl sugar amidotransferase
MSAGYRVCSRCVMDTSARDITFDADGNCNFCSEFLAAARWRAPEESVLHALVDRVRAAGKGRRYDCVVGVSGGVDSSWVLHKVVELGLRPLAVHMDNGWNSELAQNNIANLVQALDVDLVTHVIDWEEYHDLMQQFLDADVIDVELLYDNAMLAVNYRAAARFGTRYILGGTNAATEGIRMPRGWNWFKWDKRQIRHFASATPGGRLSSFPAIGTLGYMWYRWVRGIQWVSLLDAMPYEKDFALTELQRLYQYKPYPYKHYESVFTRFYQGYLLPTKFDVDKRRVHLSALVASGQLPRDAALRMCDGIAYPDEAGLQDDLDYFLKKMRWAPRDLDAYLARAPRPHSDYPSEKGLWDRFERVYRSLGRRA